MTNRTMRKATISTISVPLGTRKLLLAMGTASASFGRGPRRAPAGRAARWGPWLLLVEGEDEQRGEGQVDEVHGLHQPDGQEHDGEQPPLRLGLPGDEIGRASCRERV